MSYGIIYKATSPSGKVYIGQTTKTLSKRKADHAFRAKKGDKRRAFQLAILEHGGVSAFVWNEIDKAETAEELSQKEQYWTAYYKADDPAYGYCGTGGGISFTPNAETRRKLSEAHKGLQTGEKNPFYGKSHTNESLKKMSEAHKGRKASEETRRKMSEALKGRNNPLFGKTLSAEHRQKLSEAHKGKCHTSEQRRKISEAGKGRKHTPEARRKMSEKARNISPERRRMMSEANRGEKAPAAKLTEADVRQIKIALANGESGASLARKYNVYFTTISLIKSGKNWGWLKVEAVNA